MNIPWCSDWWRSHAVTSGSAVRKQLSASLPRTRAVRYKQADPQGSPPDCNGSYLDGGVCGYAGSHPSNSRAPWETMQRGVFLCTGLLLGNLRGTPAHATSPNGFELQARLWINQQLQYGKRDSCRQSYGTSPPSVACQILLFALEITTWLPRRGAKIRCTSLGPCDQIWSYDWSPIWL